MDNPLTLITPSDAEAVATQVLALATVKATVMVMHSIGVRTRFARNDVQTMECGKKLSVSLTTHMNGKVASGDTTRTDAAGLAELVRTTEEAAAFADEDLFEREAALPASATFTDPAIYLPSCVNAGASSFQGDLIRSAAEQAEAAGLVAAGSVGVSTDFILMMNSAGFRAHTRKAYGDLTVTARTKGGKGSGWAWAGGEDFARIDPKAVTAKAIDLCQRSDNPVAVEPGRYTVILEPEAVAQLLDSITGSPTEYMSAFEADLGGSVYSKKESGNKLGLRMADERVQILTDPMDPDLPFSPLGGDGSLYSRTDWFKDGILTNLTWVPHYAKEHNRAPLWSPDGRAKIVVDGPTHTLDEMITSTKRGIWVHHFAAVGAINPRTLLLTGVTRDGTFLIENGKIARPIKNLRFNESPFFILNKLDASGASVRASEIVVAPRLKVHDFEFTSLSDAV